MIIFFLFLAASNVLAVTDHTKEQETKAVKILRNNFITKLSDALSFSLGQTDVLTVPIFQNNKDLGSAYGVMPAVVFKSSDEENQIKTVIAPSYQKSEKLGDEFSYRHYLFMGRGELAMARVSFARGPRRETVFWYYNETFFGKNKAVDFYIFNYLDPKYSFYGYGPDTKESFGENYVLKNDGVKFSFSMPTLGKMKVEFRSTYFRKMIEDGPFGSSSSFFSRYPEDFLLASQRKKFFLNGISIFLDTTDHPFLPKIGNFLSFSADLSAAPLSSYSYTIYKAQVKKYYNFFSDKQVTAVRYEVEWLSGGHNIPFYQLPSAGETSGLRSVGEGRYTDRAKFIATVEHRITLSMTPFMKFLSELEFTPFLDIATVAKSPSKIRLDKIKCGPGAAFRLILRPHIAASANIAFGRSSANFLVNMGYPF